MAAFNSLQQIDKNKIAAYALIGMGLMLLLGIGNFIVPLVFFLFLTLPGVALLAAFQHYDHPVTNFLPIPGMLIAGTGLMLMFQWMTNYWESWAYAWTLYGVFIGLGLIMTGQRIEQPALINAGRILTAIGGISFVVLGMFFMVLTSMVFRTLITLALFIAGGMLLMKGKADHYHQIPFKRSARNADDDVERVKVKIA